MAEFGAKNAYLPPDDAVFDYLRERLRARDQRWRDDGRGGQIDLRIAGAHPTPEIAVGAADRCFAHGGHAHVIAHARPAARHPDHGPGIQQVADPAAPGGLLQHLG